MPVYSTTLYNPAPFPARRTIVEQFIWIEQWYFHNCTSKVKLILLCCWPSIRSSVVVGLSAPPTKRRPLGVMAVVWYLLDCWRLGPSTHPELVSLKQLFLKQASTEPQIHTTVGSPSISLGRLGSEQVLLASTGVQNSAELPVPCPPTTKIPVVFSLPGELTAVQLPLSLWKWKLDCWAPPALQGLLYVYRQYTDSIYLNEAFGKCLEIY